jgi:hypothetical protein
MILPSTALQGEPSPGQFHYRIVTPAQCFRQAVKMLSEKVHQAVQYYPLSAPIATCSGCGSMFSLP